MPVTIDQALRFWARDRPDQRALWISGDGIDYRTLDGWAGAVAASLIERGLGTGERVVFYADTSLEWCATALGVLRCGGVVAPLNAKMVPDEVDHLLRRYEPALVFADEAGEERLRAMGLRLPPVVTRAEAAALRGKRGAEVQRWHDPDAPALIVTTSGSTARPKGVVHTGRSLVDYAFGEMVHIAPELSGSGQRLLTTAPLSTAGGCNLLLHTIATGSSVFMLEQFSPEAALEVLCGERINVFRASPIFYQRIAGVEGFGAADLSHLRVATVGGAPPPPGLIDTWAARGVLLRQLYGQTEAGGAVTVNPAAYAMSDPDRCGHGGPLTEIRIIDGEGREVAPDTPGQIAVRGPGVMAGYWRDPEATAGVLVDGWLRTGDVGTIDARGLLRMLDRSRDIIKSGGMNISSAEVERVILEMPGVAEVAIIAVPDERFGETPFAIVHGPGCTAHGILAHCRDRLSGYKLPRYVHLEPEPLPRLAMGKISKPALRRDWSDRELPPPLR